MTTTTINSASEDRSYLIEHWRYLTTAGASPGIDTLRAVAVCMVIFYHLSLAPFGWLGVDVFFVISGFLIGGMIVDRLAAGTWKFGRFYRDRALRILPLYYLMIGLYAVIKGIPSTQGLGAAGLKAIAASMVFAHTTINWRLHWLLDESYFVDGSWSLVIEEYFYLVAPAVLFIAFRATKGTLGSIAKILSVAAFALLILKFLIVSRYSLDRWEPFFTQSMQFLFKFDELVFGVVAALFVRSWKPTATASAALIALGCGLIAAALAYLAGTPYWQEPFKMLREVAWLPALFAAGVALVAAAVHNWQIAPAPVIVLARLSYPLYLGHILLFQMNDFWNAIGVTYGTMGLIVMPIVLIAASVAFAYLLSLAVEYPFIRLYRRAEITRQ